jgi:hypothetical protein
VPDVSDLLSGCPVSEFLDQFPYNGADGRLTGLQPAAGRGLDDLPDVSGSQVVPGREKAAVRVQDKGVSSMAQSQ